MITLEQASEIALSKVRPPGIENVGYLQSVGRILAEDIFADADMPPFTKSAMDGYACRRNDLERELSVIEIIPAGKTPSQTISAGKCSKIMTGAQVPLGADTVFMIEYSEETAPGKVRFTGTKSNSNICLKGEDLRKGDRVLCAETLLKPQHIAILASVGCTKSPCLSKACSWNYFNRVRIGQPGRKTSILTNPEFKWPAALRPGLRLWVPGKLLRNCL